MPEALEDYVNVVEAARRLGVSRQMVAKLLTQGRLDGRLVSANCWLVRVASLEARLAAPTASGWHGQNRNRTQDASREAQQP